MRESESEIIKTKFKAIWGGKLNSVYKIFPKFLTAVMLSKVRYEFVRNALSFIKHDFSQFEKNCKSKGVNFQQQNPEVWRQINDFMDKANELCEAYENGMNFAFQIHTNTNQIEELKKKIIDYEKIWDKIPLAYKIQLFKYLNKWLEECIQFLLKSIIEAEHLINGLAIVMESLQRPFDNNSIANLEKTVKPIYKELHIGEISSLVGKSEIKPQIEAYRSLEKEKQSIDNNNFIEKRSWMVSLSPFSA